MMRKLFYRPIFVFSVVVIVASFCIGLFYVSLSGGEGGMAGGVFFATAIVAGFVFILECFLVKNSAATPRELLSSQIHPIMTKYLPILLLLTCLTCCNQENKSTEAIRQEQENDSAKTDTSYLENLEEPTPKADPDRFNEALALLDTEFGYQSQSVSGDTLYMTSEGVDPGLIAQFTSCADQDARLKDIDFSMVKGVKKTMVKSRETLDNMYLRVSIQEWQFENDSVAIAFTTQLTDVAMDDRECINKGGILWWQTGDKFYLMTTPAYRFFFEFDKIKTVLDKKLK